MQQIAPPNSWERYRPKHLKCVSKITESLRKLNQLKLTGTAPRSGAPTCVSCALVSIRAAEPVDPWGVRVWHPRELCGPSIWSAIAPVAACVSGDIGATAPATDATSAGAVGANVCGRCCDSEESEC
jgi:hypothetical protein